MAWCPKCRTEYRPHIARCADCGAELVEVLPEEEPVAATEEPYAGPYEKHYEEVLLCSVFGEPHVALIRQALEAEGIPSREQPADARDIGFTGALRQYIIGIFVNRRDEARAREIYEAYEGAEG